MSEPIIQTSKLTKRFKDFIAVDAIDLQVDEGTIHGFIGPNGAGKTTTIKMLIGAINASAGTGTIQGHSLGSMAARRLIGYSPEHPAFYKNMNPLMYLTYIGRSCGMKNSHARERAFKLLDWLELDDFAIRKIQGFSAGQRQRLGLAQAMIHEPKVLILDEPTANLDPTGRMSIIEKLKSLAQKKNVTIFISSHILSELEKLVDYVTFLHHGKVVIRDQVKNLERVFSQNHFLLNTSDNKKTKQLLEKENLSKEAWVDEKNIVHLTTDDEEKLKREIPKLVYQAKLTLEYFGKKESHLEDIYQQVEGQKDIKTSNQENIKT